MDAVEVRIFPGVVRMAVVEAQTVPGLVVLRAYLVIQKVVAEVRTVLELAEPRIFLVVVQKVAVVAQIYLDLKVHRIYLGVVQAVL